MLKRVLLRFFLLGLCLTGSLIYANETPKANYTWTKIGDGFYEVWDLNEPLFVENVENYNRAMLAKARMAGEKFSSWESIKPNRNRLGLRISNVKYRDSNGLIKVMDNKIFFRKLTYGNGKELYIKGVRDRDKIIIEREDNSPTPKIYASKNNNYFFFMDEECIWGIRWVFKSGLEFEVDKLTKDTVNGKTKDNIRAGLTDDEYLYWVEQPVISSDGSYIAYISNKNGLSKNSDAPLELWILDIKKRTENFVMILKDDSSILGWIDDNNLLYSINHDYYLFNAIDNTSQLLLKDVSLMNFSGNIFVYAKKSKIIYVYNRMTKKEISSPQFPDKVNLPASYSPFNYSFSPDGYKIIIDIYERDSTHPQGIRVIYLVDLASKSFIEIKMPKEEKIFLLGKWLNNKEVTITTFSSLNGLKNYKTWIISID